MSTTLTDSLTGTAVEQLDRLIAVATNERNAFDEHDDPDPLATARLVAAAADAADRLALVAPECFL